MIQYCHNASDIFLEGLLHSEYWAFIRDTIPLVIASVHQKPPLISTGQTMPNSLIARYTVISGVKGKGIEHTPGHLAQSDSLSSSFRQANPSSTHAYYHVSLRFTMSLMFLSAYPIINVPEEPDFELVLDILHRHAIAGCDPHVW